MGFPGFVNVDFPVGLGPGPGAGLVGLNVDFVNVDFPVGLGPGPGAGLGVGLVTGTSPHTTTLPGKIKTKKSNDYNACS